MSSPTSSRGLVATVAAGLLLLSACGGADPAGPVPPEAVSIAIGEPVRPLVPGDTVEEYGSQVVGSLWTGLVEYGADGAVGYTGVAESVDSPDNTTWTIRLRDGWTFHDGTPVTARSFVDAWNHTAYSPNAQSGSSFFADVEGYEDLQAPTDDAGEPTGDPAATEMSGLRVVDDLTFTVTLTAPFAQFPVTLGHNPFLPLPEVFFADPEGFGRHPVGNGRFRVRDEYVPGAGVTLLRYDDYAGERPASVDALEYRVYGETATAYTDALGDALDVVPTVPPEAGGTARQDFGDRYLETAASGFTYLALPLYQERYVDPRVRRAISLAIDREAIAAAFFAGSRRPADSVVAPVVEGYRPGACQACVLDVERANDLLDEAGFDRAEPVELWFNAGAGNDAWMEAVGNQLRRHLGVEFVLRGDLAPAEYGPLVDGRGMTGPFRLGWSMDYPSPQNYLEPLYATGAGANATSYSNPVFDALVAQGDAAPTAGEAIAFYNRAEDVLLEDMPVVPLFFQVTQSVHSTRVDDVVVDVLGRVDTASLTTG
ncbi:ABC transporter substrate-binding protein [Geodermatophilus sp. SYSU D00758]